MITEIDMGQNLEQLRAVTIPLGKDRTKAVAATYSEDAEVDPQINMFYFQEPFETDCP